MPIADVGENTEMEWFAQEVFEHDIEEHPLGQIVAIEVYKLVKILHK